MRSLVFLSILYILVNLYSSFEFTEVLEEFDDGSPKKTALSDGEMKRNEKNFRIDGSIEQIKYYNYWFHNIGGYWIRYNQNGEETSKGNFIIGENEDYYIENEMNGEHCLYYPDGKLKVKMNFKNNLFYGHWNEYYENGQIKVQNHHEFKNYDGQAIQTFYNNGYLKELYCIKDSLKHGDYIDFYSNGEIKSFGKFIAGFKSGNWKLFYKNGKKKQDAIYYKSEYNPSVILEITEYYKNGKEKIKATFNAKNEIETFILYKKNGELKKKFNSIEEIKDSKIRGNSTSEFLFKFKGY